MIYIQRAGYILRQLNDKFYFHVSIDTVISWAVIVLMYLLYKLLNKYFKDDNQLDSFELIKLLGIYMLILSVITASYIDIGEITKRANPEYSFFMITIVAIGLVVLLSWASREKPSAVQNIYFTKITHRNLILLTLYAPILVLMLTNGRILEQRTGTLKHFMPRSDITFLDIPGEVTEFRVGGVVTAEQLEKLEEIISSHRDVSESAVVGHRDTDNMIKPYAFVVLHPDAKASGDLQKDIMEYVADKIEANWISPGMYSKNMEFVDQAYLVKVGAGSLMQQKVRKIINEHRAVADSRVTGPPENSVAYVVLKPGYAPSADQAKDIIRFVYKKIKENNRISDYLKPHWVEFADKDRIPRESDGRINHNILQKKKKNWTELFPKPPEDDTFVKEFESQM
ncbi:MAG: hypothetical protein R2941_07770 [Desulfobacterales bacterium]